MRRTGKRHTAVMAGFIGNVVEWYDFALYGYMAGIIANLFFPGEDSIAALIATYGVFAAGFLMRPLGSVVFGWLGDTLGRSPTMLISVSLMALPTLLLGCLPVYDSIGLWAPLLLVLIRLVQGLSVGGEFSSSVTYLVETAPRSRRGLAGSWANTGTMVGMLLGSAVAALTTSLFAQETLLAWGWRVPFLLGGILGITSILMRRHLPKSEEFQRHHEERPETSPLRRALTENRLEMVQAVVFASAYGALFYLPLVYLPEWLSRFTGLPLDVALRINTFATMLLLVLIPLSGWIGDHGPRRTHFIALAMLVMALVAWPAYAWLHADRLVAAVVVQFGLVVLLAVPLGSAPAMFVELFPAEDRLSGYSVAYNLGLGVIGGATPMFATWLIEVTGYAAVPGVLLAACALVAGLVMLWMRDRSREPLR